MKPAPATIPKTAAELLETFQTKTQQPALFSPAELPPRLWTLEEVADFLQVSKDWVRDHATRRNPRIPCVRLGGYRKVLRFRPEDVLQFVNSHISGDGR